MHQFKNNIQTLTRRTLLGNTTCGIGAAALASLLQQDSNAFAALPSSADASNQTNRRPDPLAPKPPHFAPKAKNVIYIHLVGAPSHLDLFDHKPELVKQNGKLCPDEMFKGKQLAFIRQQPKLLGTRFKFKPSGQSGLQLSEILPNLQTVADDLCLIKSIHTDQFNHGPAQLVIGTGFGRFGRPSVGAWATYGLGSANKNLPGYVVLITGSVAGAGNALWGSGFLPTVYQGVEFRSQGDPVLFLSNPKGVNPKVRRDIVTAVNQLNQQRLDDVGDPEIATRIDQYELAYRMQTSVPELMDTSKESKRVHEMYGTKPGQKSFANNCLLARRLVQRGVRFVQLFDQGWDHHSGVFSSLPKKAKQVDQPIAALIKDLKSQGMLDETLVVWSAEFGRTPMLQGKSNTGQEKNVGRDHHKEGYTLFMAGGGVKGGYSHGATDELGYKPVKDAVHIHDFNATILHQLGLNHEQLTYKFQGRQYRLTDVHGHVIQPIIA
jgi:hypothetical protein